MNNGINKTWFFEQPPSKVWDYLTKPELIEQWLMKSDFKPIVGHKFSFSFSPKPNSQYEGTIDCEVLEVHPYTDLSYTWNGRTLNPSRNFTSTVVWTLVPKHNGTELLLQHYGFDIPEDIVNHTNGWENCLKKIQEQFNNINL